jgi:hypothetical protein
VRASRHRRLVPDAFLRSRALGCRLNHNISNLEIDHSGAPIGRNTRSRERYVVSMILKLRLHHELYNPSFIARERREEHLPTARTILHNRRCIDEGDQIFSGSWSFRGNCEPDAGSSQYETFGASCRADSSVTPFTSVSRRMPYELGASDPVHTHRAARKRRTKGAPWHFRPVMDLGAAAFRGRFRFGVRLPIQTFSASTCRGLIAVAISLAILVIIQLEITSWRVGENASDDLQLMVTSRDPRAILVRTNASLVCSIHNDLSVSFRNGGASRVSAEHHKHYRPLFRLHDCAFGESGARERAPRPKILDIGIDRHERSAFSDQNARQEP